MRLKWGDCNVKLNHGGRKWKPLQLLNADDAVLLAESNELGKMLG